MELERGKLFFLTAGLWLLNFISAGRITIISNGDGIMHDTSGYGIDVQGVSCLLFQVKGCNDGFFRLYSGSDFSTASSASILLGGWGNDKCKMEPCAGCGARYSPRYPYLHCDEFRPMWIKWTGGLLSIGEGSYVGEKTFMYTEEQRSFDIKYIGVGSGWDKVFHWVFDGPAGNFFERVVPSGFTTRGQLSSVTSASLWDCIQECRKFRGCKSVSFSKSTGGCDLGGERTRPGDIQVDNAVETWFERNV